VMLRDDSDVVQSSVQLMNYHSNWYSVLNVLEYFFWFRSGIILFNKLAGVTPLGGNTVFFKKDILEKIDGWSEDCLTEDALVGIEFAKKNATFSIVYDAKYSTQEETPPTLESFIKQRTRWHQGFLQILFGFDWLQLPQLRQKVLVGYVLAQPLI